MIRASCQSDLPLFSFDMYEVLEEAKGKFTDKVFNPVDVFIIKQATLACIQMDGTRQAISLHRLLNHCETPREIIKFIFIHELIHIIIPSELNGGKIVMHTVKFWEEEKRIIPERNLYWGWMYFHFFPLFRKEKESEGIFIRRGWEKTMAHSRLSLQGYLDLGKVLNENQNSTMAQGL
ncbi:MAG: hypothetical protein FD137_744 [Spirochaetes bacterium]|nr:MAG: hypothetical protein FD137_744 [Spirochaetota bacterium]